MTKNKTGTKEWAVFNVNIDDGCGHGCRYCYARHDAVCHWKRLTQEQWDNPVTKQHKVDLPYKKKYDDWVMFPTTHDITPRNINEYICVLKKLLDAGNQVLIVSKPHWDCITLMCETLLEYQKQIMFRFTIGSAKNEILEFWEPNAPNFAERLGCLQYAYKKGYATSVSCEPYLDAWPHHVYAACEEWVTDTIWFGKLNHMNSRVDFSKISEADMAEYVEPLKKAQTDDVILGYVKIMKNWPKVEWKDSIKDVIKKHKISKSPFLQKLTKASVKCQ